MIPLRISWANLLAGTALLLTPICSPAQAMPPKQSPEPQTPHLAVRTPEETERRRLNLRSIVLDVQVLDAAGTSPADLDRSAFTLLEDGHPRTIVDFRPIHGTAATDPVQIVIVLDTLNNSSGKVKQYRKEIEKYLASGAPVLAHPTSIAVVSDSGIKLGSATTDRADLLQELNEPTGNPHGITCADATAERSCSVPDGIIGGQGSSLGSCDPNPRLSCLNHQFKVAIPAVVSLGQELTIKQGNKQSRTIVVWIGPGWPLLNDNGFIPDTPEDKDRIFHNLVEVSSALNAAHITLDAVASNEVLPINPRQIKESFFFKGVAEASGVSAASLALQALAYQSGGIVLASTKDIAGQIARCAADLESYYELTFQSPPAVRDGEHHSLAVKVARPGTTVRTRTLYYGEQ